MSFISVTSVEALDAMDVIRILDQEVTKSVSTQLWRHDLIEQSLSLVRYYEICSIPGHRHRWRWVISSQCVLLIEQLTSSRAEDARLEASCTKLDKKKSLTNCGYNAPEQVSLNSVQLITCFPITPPCWWFVFILHRTMGSSGNWYYAIIQLICASIIIDVFAFAVRTDSLVSCISCVVFMWIRSSFEWLWLWYWI